MNRYGYLKKNFPKLDRVEVKYAQDRHLFDRSWSDTATLTEPIRLINDVMKIPATLFWEKFDLGK